MQRFLPHLIVVSAIAGAHSAGLLGPLQFALSDVAFRMTPRPASGQIVVVEIDPQSLQRIGPWPWPRRHHAALVDRLLAAGARDIALDIDFRDRSGPRDDRALAGAIARAGGRIVLPVFRESVGTEGGATGTVYAAPFPPFAAHARLGTVNIRLEEDGRARRYPTVDEWNGQSAPSMAAVLAADRRTGGAFFIDYGVRLETIPRLSYADVLSGDFDSGSVAGRSVIVGATAVELGDRLAVPVHRVLPGPMVQALAFESLVQNRALGGIEPLAVFAAAFLLAMLLGRICERRPWRTGLGMTAAVTAASAGLPVAVLATVPVLVDTTPLILVAVLTWLCSLRPAGVAGGKRGSPESGPPGAAEAPDRLTA